MTKLGKCAIFIDNSNIFKNMNSISYDYRLDWLKLIKYFETNDFWIWDTWFFMGESGFSDGQSKFIRALRDYGFNTVTLPLKKKDMRCDECGHTYTSHVEKGVDIAIATQMLRLLYSDAFDTAILVSGDGDLCGVVREIRNHGRRVVVVSFRRSLSHELREHANDVIYLDDIADEIKLERTEYDGNNSD